MSKFLCVCFCLMVPLLGVRAADTDGGAAVEELDWGSVSRAIQGSYEKISSLYNDKGVSVSGQRFQRWSDGEERRTDVTVAVLKGMELNQVRDSQAGVTIVNAHNDRYAFKVKKEDNAPKWNPLEQVDDPLGLADRESNHLNMFPMTEGLFGGFVVYDLLKDIIGSNSFAVKSLRATEDGNGVVFEFTVDYSVSDFIHISGGTVELLKPYWVIKRFEIQCPCFFEGQPPQNFTDTANIDYYVIDDVPYPKMITHTILNNGKESQNGFQFEEPQIGSLNKNQFKLKGYGLPEPANGNALSLRARTLALAIGLVLLLLGWGLRRLLARGENAPQDGIAS